MTKQNPFDAAIVLLRKFLGVRTLNGVPFDGASLVAALNVLEAAGKVDKERAIAMLGNMTVNLHDEWGLRTKAEIRTYLAALPDEEPR